jgi:hypothetical protein
VHNIRDWKAATRWSALATLAMAVWTPHLVAQEPTDSLRVELRRLAVLVDSLRAEVARLQEAGRATEAEDALAELRAAAQAAAEAGAPAPDAEAEEFVGRQRSLQALNPEISLNSDIFASLDPDASSTDNFYAREFEISLMSNLDPFSRAKVFISRHGAAGEIPPFGEEDGEEGEEGHHSGSFAVEEGYVEWVGLPGGLGLKVGRFFQRFGTLNRWHSHALPFQSRSLPHQAFIGEESLAQAGASVGWLAPFGGGAGTYDATLEVTATSSEHLFGEADGVTVLGHVNGFWQLTPAVDLDLGASWVGSRYEDEAQDFSRNLYGLEMSLTWAPPEASRYRGLNVRGGVMLLDGLVAPEVPDPGVEPATSAVGFWSMAELRFSRSWRAGGRFEWAEDPAGPDESAWLAGPTLTWWQSEFVRVRAEYDLVGHSRLDDRGRFYLQITFAMGPHKHESY